MGELEGDVDYREIMRREGIDVPADEAVDESMEDVAVGTVAEEESIGGKDNGEGVQANTPVQGNTIGDVDPKLQQPMATYGDLRQPMDTNLRQPMAKPMDGATADLRQPMERPMADLRTPMDRPTVTN